MVPNLPRLAGGGHDAAFARSADGDGLAAKIQEISASPLEINAQRKTNRS
jgi:hypothetical protein